MSEIIGITGGIGTGKSRVCRYLAELTDWPFIDVDQICRQLLAPQAAGCLALRQVLANAFFTASGELDRKQLRNAIFADSELRQQVDSLLHPLAKQEMAAQAAAQSSSFVLAEIPLLFEAGWQDSVAVKVVVSASETACVQRIMARDQVTETQARQAIAAQMPLEEKIRLADYLINNTENWQETCVQIQQLVMALDSHKHFFIKKS